MKVFKKILSTLLLLAAICAISLFKQYIVSDYPILPFTGAGEDDVLMVNNAKSIYDGRWLGDYKYNTLMKGPSFPLYLAFLRQHNLSYINSTTALYTLACLIFMIAIRKIVKNKFGFFLIFVVLLLNPIMYNQEVIQRVYRNSLVPPVSMLIIAAYIGMFLRSHDNFLKLIPWSVLAAASLSFFYYIREDSMWILPFVIFMTFATFIGFLTKEKMGFVAIVKFFIEVMLLAVPIITFFYTTEKLALYNEKMYGIKTTNVLKDSNFVEAMDTIYSIKPSEELRYISVTRDKMNKMAEVSPSFNAIMDQLNIICDTFAKIDRNPFDKEVEDGWWFWAFRIAASSSGYNTVEKEEELYQKINKELKQAITEGKFETQKTMPSSLTPPWRENFKEFLPLTISSAIRFVSSFEDIEFPIARYERYDDPNTYNIIKTFEDMSGDRALFDDDAVDTEGNPVEELKDQQEYTKTLIPKYKIVNRLIFTYKVVSPMLGMISWIVYIAISLIAFVDMFMKNFESLKRWVVCSSLLGAFFTIIVGVSYNHVASCNSVTTLYLSGAYSVYLAFMLVTIYSIFAKGYELVYPNGKEVVMDAIESDIKREKKLRKEYIKQEKLRKKEEKNKKKEVKEEIIEEPKAVEEVKEEEPIVEVKEEPKKQPKKTSTAKKKTTTKKISKSKSDIDSKKKTTKKNNTAKKSSGKRRK